MIIRCACLGQAGLDEGPGDVPLPLEEGHQRRLEPGADRIHNNNDMCLIFNIYKNI